MYLIVAPKYERGNELAMYVNYTKKVTVHN